MHEGMKVESSFFNPNKLYMGMLKLFQYFIEIKIFLRKNYINSKKLSVGN